MPRWNIRDAADGLNVAPRSALGGAVASLALALVLPAAGQAQGVEHVPHAVGDSAANIPVKAASQRILNRWVARRSGRLDRLYLQIKVDNTSCRGGSSGYASGTSGVLVATTYRVRPNGQPDYARELASDRFVPCDRYVGGTAAVEMEIDVTRGQEYATVVRNGDPRPTVNWFSQNFLYQFDGLSGANSRNERDPRASDVNYGLDPRELVGWSVDGGARWKLPGGPYGPRGGAAFLPTYVQRFADGYVDGQPYYYPRSLDSSAIAVYPTVPETWEIKRLGLYTAKPGSGTIVLKVNGTERARAVVSGDGLVSRAITPVTAPRGSTVSVSASGSLTLPRLSADKTWEDLIGLGQRHRFYLSADPRRTAPVFPLPMFSSAVPRPPTADSPAKRLTGLRVVTSRRSGVARVKALGDGRLRIIVTARGTRIRTCGPTTVRKNTVRRCRFSMAPGVSPGHVRAVALLTPTGRSKRIIGRASAGVSNAR